MVAGQEEDDDHGQATDDDPEFGSGEEFHGDLTCIEGSQDQTLFGPTFGVAKTLDFDFRNVIHP